MCCYKKGAILAFAGFYYLVESLTGTKNVSLSQFRAAANHSCENNTGIELTGELLDNDLENIQSGVCFKSQYIFTLLTQGYGFNETNWDKVHFQNSVTTSQPTDIGWTLGLMLNASNAIPAELPTPTTSLVVYVLMVLLFVAFIILSVGFACHARNTRSEVIPHRRLSTYGAV
ncbi:Ectonucleoside triphosphate diphosphohydrolase 1 [Lamellibrachia satsuma]|nr:Ectonucleoside triphosphate diphosphohydrolase 1 [Lamellibrachia satsuma]